MDNKVERFRERVRKMVPDGYTHVGHIAQLAAFTLTPIPLLIAALFIWGMPWIALVGIPMGILVGNFVEYAMHRWPMHRVYRRIGKWMYKRHSGVHHVAFQYSDMVIADDRDWYHVMMAAGPAALFMFTIIVATSTAYLLGGGAIAAVMGIVLCLYFFAEEMLHLSFHLPSTWNGTRWWNKALRRLAHHHHVHHDTKVMHDVNFNIALPIFDYVFNTVQR